MSTQRRVILTSNGLSSGAIRAEFSRILKLRQPDVVKARVLYIPDAIIAEGSPYSSALDEFKESLKYSFNISQVSGVELAKTTEEELKEKLENTDVVYAECGNTFYLHYHMHQSNFRSLLLPLLDKGVIYVGSSAGTICAGKSVSIALWKGWDNPGVVPKIDYEGLDLLGNRSFFPHYSAQWSGLVDRKSKTLPHEVLTLTDSQCFSTDETGERVLE